jgi:hypothetical protein
MDTPNNDEIGTVNEACAVIGGSRPVSRATYYRGVKEGRYDPPLHPSPGISRVNLTALRRQVLANGRAE